MKKKEAKEPLWKVAEELFEDYPAMIIGKSGIAYRRIALRVLLLAIWDRNIRKTIINWDRHHGKKKRTE